MKIPVKKSIAIVGDGPSATPLRHLVIPQNVYVIGVNYASVWLPRCDAYMTCFPDHRQRFLMNNQRQGIRYFAAVPPSYGSAFSKGDLYGPRERNVTFFTRSEHVYGMNPDPEKINGSNSVWAAMGLAYHMSAQKIGLFGLDGTDKVRVSGGKPSLPDLEDIFSSYDGAAEVVNGSINSEVKCFPRMTATAALEWLL